MTKEVGALRTPEDRMRGFLLKRLNTLVSQAGYAQSRAETLQTQMNEQIREIQENYAPLIDRETRRRDDAVDKIAKIVEEHWDLVMDGKPGKTLKLRGGEIVRRATSKVEVTNTKKALEWLRRHKMLRRFTTQAEPTLSKAKLKEEPKVLAKMPGAELVTSENMTIKPVKAHGELVRELHPMRRPVSTT